MYLSGLLPLFLEGRIKPTGSRVLLKAIKRQTQIQLSQGADESLIICYEVVAKGPHVRELEVGDHCLCITVAGEPYGDYITIRERDVCNVWKPISQAAPSTVDP